MAARSWKFTGVFFIFLLALELPVMSVSLPPLVDYPNHLARMHLIAQGGGSYWRVRWGILPNLAEDAFVWLAAGSLPVELAGRAFLFLAVAVDAIGMVWLGLALRDGSRTWSLLPLMFLWSASLLWGFLNYSFGVGLAFLGAAGWLVQDRRPALRAVLAVPIALAIWFAHVEAFVIYAILVCGFEIRPCLEKARAGRRREAIRAALLVAPPFVIPIGLLLFAWHASAGENWEPSGFWRKPDLIFNAFENYNLPLDLVSLISFVALFGWMLSTGRLRIVGRAVPALALLVVAFLAAPNHLYSGGGADHRLPAVILELFVAASAPRFRSPREAAWIYGAALTLFLVRLCVLEGAWLGAQRIYARDLAILDQVRPGSTVAVGQGANAIKFSSAPEPHMPLMATVRRDAFVPTLFAFPEQQPIVPTPRAAALRAAISPDALWSAFVDRDAGALAGIRPALARFDYLLLVGLKPFRVPADVELAPLGETPTFKLFAIRKAGTF